MQKKCREEIGALFFITEPLELKSKKTNTQKCTLFFTRCLALLKHSPAPYSKVMLMTC
jgi:hypothetical protein